MIKVIAFDIFGTVYDLSAVDRSEIARYHDHVTATKYRPLHLGEEWRALKAHEDSAYGITRLRRNFRVVTLSNCPIELQVYLHKLNGIQWDMLVPLEAYEVFKPHLNAYGHVMDLMGVRPEEVAMVTANPTFGDVNGAKSWGMRPILIRQADGIKDIIDLDKQLERERALS